MTNDIFEIVEERLKDKLDSLKTKHHNFVWDSERSRSERLKELYAKEAAEVKEQIDKLSLILELWKDVNI